MTKVWMSKEAWRLRSLEDEEIHSWGSRIVGRNGGRIMTGLGR